MSEKNKAILIQPNAALLEEAKGIMGQSGWESLGFDSVDSAIGALNGHYDALVVGIGDQWFDAVTLLKAVAGVNPQARAIAWLNESMQKVEDELKNDGIGIVFKADTLPEAINSLPAGETTDQVVSETGVVAYMLIQATDGMHAPGVFNAVMATGADVWALKHKDWHMIVRVQGKEDSEVKAKLDEISGLKGIKNTEKLIATINPGSLDTALLNTRRTAVNTTSFAFCKVDLSDTKDATQTLALCPGVTAVAVAGNQALVQVAGSSLVILQETISRGIYALPAVLGVKLFAGLNILEVE